jgi:general secretion pathway protein H
MRYPAQRRADTGFSLIEILVVIFIIGLTLSIASLTINRGGPRDDLFDAIEMFMGQAQFAGDRAILSGETMGLLLEPPLWQAGRGENPDDIGWRYRWYTSSSEGWQVLPNMPAVTLPASIELEVEIDDMAWEYQDQLDRTTPLLAYYPTGDITPFAIVLHDKRERDFVQNIEVNENGDLVWVEAPTPPEEDDHAF